jgi:hypothetical protein
VNTAIKRDEFMFVYDKYIIDFTFYGVPMTEELWVPIYEPELNPLTAQRRIAYSRNMPLEDFEQCHVIGIRSV